MSKKNTAGAQAPALTKSDLQNAVVPASHFASGFVDAAAFQMPASAVVKTMAPMIKPKDFPVGKVLVGRFKSIFETKPGKAEDGTDKLGEGIEIVPDGAQLGVAIPAGAVIRRALEIEGRGAAATSKFLGKTIAVQKLAEKIPSKKGNDAWNFVIAILD